ncbi:unnamed protein product [Cuscuta campestris]|uniref:Uncharacterized protein n=1 Tax=Cuscuta campestris TaxID=132261 RepID=A0A484MVT3_9ASTE|nr:unnamed protein product [Cuscuta campestris]
MLAGGPRLESSTPTTTLDKLHETLDMLEKKENVLNKKVAAEIERAKGFFLAKNKRMSLQCLKRKRLYERQLDELGVVQLRLLDRMISLEGAKATTESVDTSRTGEAAMNAMHKAINIDEAMDGISKQNMRQVREALSTDDFDEDEMDAELEA